jgi:hypothetical protein
MYIGCKIQKGPEVVEIRNLKPFSVATQFDKERNTDKHGELKI